jgi:uncharacterized membrane protein YhaH (DUF805 family)
MNYQSLASWFSWKGRVNRLPYILVALAISVLAFFLESAPDEGAIPDLFLLPVVLLSLYVFPVTAIKRSHDRGRSGFFVLLLFVPLINLWAGIELMFFRGTSGPNKYGEDPLW